MRYLNTQGELVGGEVWSPGPLPRSVWVLPADGGSPLVVRLETAKNPHREVDWDPTTLDPALLESTPGRSAVYLSDYRYAPSLSEKDWKAALAA